MKPPTLEIHPCCPKRLLTALRRAKGENGKGWNFSKLARTLHVNKGTIYKLVVYGIEPKVEDLRVKVFLPRRSHKRVGDCNRCGKRLEVMKNGTLESHTHPDGTYCPGSETYDFLRAKKISRKNRIEIKPVHMVWWGKLDKEYKEGVIFHAYLKSGLANQPDISDENT